MVSSFDRLGDQAVEAVAEFILIRHFGKSSKIIIRPNLVGWYGMMIINATGFSVSVLWSYHINWPKDLLPDQGCTQSGK